MRFPTFSKIIFYAPIATGYLLIAVLIFSVICDFLGYSVWELKPLDTPFGILNATVIHADLAEYDFSGDGHNYRALQLHDDTIRKEIFKSRRTEKQAWTRGPLKSSFARKIVVYASQGLSAKEYYPVSELMDSYSAHFIMSHEQRGQGIRDASVWIYDDRTNRLYGLSYSYN